MVFPDKTMATKKTLGRQKIEIKKLEKKTHKQVTFSKRRTGLFKKAGELCVLCGAEVAVIVFSPNEKVFCFGHPNVDSVVDRFLASDSSSPKPAENYVPVAEFNKEYAEALKELEKEKRRAAEVREKAKTERENGCFWWDLEIENLNLEELKKYRSALLELRGKVVEKIESSTLVRMGGTTSSLMVPTLPPPSSFTGFGNSYRGILENGFGNHNGGVHGFGFGNNFS